MSANDQIVVVKIESPDKVVVGSVESIVSDSSFITTATITNTENIVVESESTSVITVGVGAPGPQGLPGPSGGEEEMPYAKQTDFVGDDIIYKGEALVGSALSAPAWRIRKIVIGVDGDVSEKWASGDSLFNKIWDNRVSLSYS